MYVCGGGSVHLSDIVTTGYNRNNVESAGLGGNAGILSQSLELGVQL